MTGNLKHGVTLFVPLYNEEAVLHENAEKLVCFLKGFSCPWEIILGSNGSTDRTCEIGIGLSKQFSQITFFHIPARGPGLAFKEAVPKARFTHFICQDADLSTDLQFIKSAHAALQACDAAVGTKHDVQSRPFYRIFVSELFIFCTNLLLQMPFRDYSIGAKGYRTSLLLPLMPYVDRHTFYTQEILYRLLKDNRKIVAIPVQCEDWRKTRFNLLHEGFYRFLKLFSLWIKCLK